MPLVVVPHPFGLHDRTAITDIAATCVEEILRLLRGSSP